MHSGLLGRLCSHTSGRIDDDRDRVALGPHGRMRPAATPEIEGKIAGAKPNRLRRPPSAGTSFR